MHEYWKVIRFANGRYHYRHTAGRQGYRKPTRVSPVGLHKDIGAAREQLQVLEDSSGSNTRNGKGKRARQFAIVRNREKALRWYNKMADELMEQFGTLAPTAIT